MIRSEIVNRMLLKKFMNKICHRYKDHFIKYVLVGGFNYVSSLLFFVFLTKVIGINYLIVFTITWIYGILITYCLNYLWVFKPEKRLIFKIKFLKYFIVYITSFSLNFIALHWIVENIYRDPIMVQLVILPFVMLFNFLGFRNWALTPPVAHSVKRK